MFKNKSRHYSLRKLSVGLASVLIGISFASTAGNSVKADTVESGSNSAQTVVKGSDTAVKIGAKDDTNAIESNTEFADEASKKDSNAIAQDIKQKATEGNILETAMKNVTDGSQIAAESTLKGSVNTNKDDSSKVAEKGSSTKDNSLTANNNALKATVEAAKQGLEKPAVSHSDSNETTLNIKGSKAIAENMLKEDKENQADVDPAKSKLKMATLLTTTGKKFNAQMLFASKIMSPAKNTNDAFALNPQNGLHEHANVNDNGGYDEDYWGKLNINDWNYTTNGNTITITGYKGNNPSSLIIPNGADFDFANRRDTVQSSAEISSDVMHDLAKNATRIGLSKTDNKKVIAADSIWNDAFGGLTDEPGTNSNADGGIKYGSPNLTQMDLHNLDTTAITSMGALFNGGSNLITVGDLSDWNTSNVTMMESMFQTASSLTNIGNLDNWDTSKVTNMRWMFGDAPSLTNIGDLSKWQTGNVTDMDGMFYNTTNLTNIGDLSKWQTGNVTDMNWMFGDATSLINIGDLSKWQTGNVTDMSHMFHNTKNLTNIGDLSKWQTGNVTDMNSMFRNATSLINIGDLSKWQTGNATNMSEMFYGAEKLTNIGNLSKWQTDNVTDMNWMFGDATSLINIGDLSKWQTGNVTDMSDMFNDAENLTNIGDLSKWDTSNVTDMSRMFGYTENLTNIGDLSEWQTGNVTNMSEMFYGDKKLTNIGDLSKWQTGNVTDMSGMFNDAENLTNIGDLSKWDTSNVTDMSRMFGYTENLTNIGDLSKWDTSKVTNMSGMFTDTEKLTNIGNLDNWDTSKVTDMSDMFSRTNLANIGDLSKWQTGKVTNMGWMFNAENLTNIGDLSKWDTSNVTKMTWMFDYAINLTNIGDLSKWDTSKVTDMDNMFDNAKALRYLNISNWDLTKLSHKLPNKDFISDMFGNDTDLTVIANDVKLPTWYQNEITDAKIVWANHMAVITNVPELINSTGAINNLEIDNQDASRSIFYDSKGSSDAIQVLKDANQAYINKYEQDHPKYLLALDASVDQTNPIALANAAFKTSHKIIDVVQTDNSTRTIIVHLPNGTTQTIVQIVGLKRNAQKDLVTEIINSTAPWGLDAANSSYTINGAKQAQTAYKQNSNIITFSSIRLPKVPGYKAKVAKNNGLLLVSYLALAPEKPKIDTALNELQFSNKLATNNAVKSNLIVKSNMYKVVNDDHDWQLPVIKSYELKYATNKNQITFAYTKDKQYDYRFVLTFKDGQYRLVTFNKEDKLLKTYSIKSYDELAKIIHSLVLMNIA